MDTNVSPAVWYARIFGIVLALVGIIGLALHTDQQSTTTLFGAIEVNLVHNLLFLVTGVFGVAVAFMAFAPAALYALITGAVFLLLGAWGLVAGAPFNPLGLFANINSAGTWLHLVIGIVGIATWVMAREGVTESAS